VVRHRDSSDAAEAVAAQLGGLEVEQDDAVPSGHLQVVLGADARGRIPGLPAPASSSAPAAVPVPTTPAATTPAATSRTGEQAITAAGVPCVD